MKIFLMVLFEAGARQELAQELARMELENTILTIVLVISLMVLLGLISGIVFIDRRTQRLENKMKLKNQ